MAVTTRESFVQIWRPVFADGEPSDLAVSDAWVQTQALLVERYGPRLTQGQMQDLVAEMTISWLLRAFSPHATGADTELASVAQHAALWLEMLHIDLDRLYDGYYRLLEEWGMYG